MAYIPHYDETTVEKDAMAYAHANTVINELHRRADLLTIAEYKDLRRQALRGDVEGARARLKMMVWTRE